MHKLLIQGSLKLIGLLALWALAINVEAQGQGPDLTPGPEFVVNTTIPGDQSSPAVGALAGGGFVIAWPDSSGLLHSDHPERAIAVRVFDPQEGQPVTGELLVNSTVSDLKLYQGVAGLTGGDFVILWYHRGGLAAQRFNATGDRLGDEIAVRHGPIYWHNAIAALDNGGYVIAFPGHGAQGDIFFRRYNSGGAELDSSWVMANVPATGKRSRVRASGLPGGGFVLVWLDESQGDHTGPLYARIFAESGTPVSGEILVGPAKYTASVATLTDGDFIVAWPSSPEAVPGEAIQSSDLDIYARRFSSAGTPVGPAFRVNSTVEQIQFQPAIAALQDGGYVIAWRDRGLDENSSPGSLENIRAQRFSAADAPVGAEFQVNVTSSGQQGGPSLAGLPCGGFVASWTDGSQSLGHPGADVRARVYTGVCAPEPPNCETDTAYAEGGSCLCRFTGMVPVSATACACPAGTELGSDPVSGRPACVPVPPPSCDPVTTVPAGGACQCLSADMERVDEWRCACPGNGRLVQIPGRPWRCVRDREDERRCPPGQFFNSELERCVRMATTCPDNQVVIGGRCMQIRDQSTAVGGRPFAPVHTGSTPTCTPPPPGMRFWLAFDGDYTDLIAGLPGAPSSGVSLISDVPAGHEAHAGRLPVNGRIDFTANPVFGLGAGDFTLDAWVRTTEVSTRAVPVIDTRLGSAIASAIGGNSHVTGVLVFIYQGRLAIQMADGSFANFVSDSFVANGEWRHVAISVRRGDAQGGRMYVDGHLVHTFDPTARSGSLGAANPMTIGFDRAFNRHSGAIDIDEVEIFNRALEPNEIFPLAQMPKCRPGTYQPALP